MSIVGENFFIYITDSQVFPVMRPNAILRKSWECKIGARPVVANEPFFLFRL
jgi:hypothetical protein